MAKTKQNKKPAYFEKATITCACKNVFKVGSTRESIDVDICSSCHPFYTGEGKLVDTRGRVDRFKKLVERSKSIKNG